MQQQNQTTEVVTTIILCIVVSVMATLILKAGGTCTAGSPVGNWCYVNKDMCQDQEKYKGKYYSVEACSKPCVCNGETDEIGLGGSCGEYCYVDHDSTCTDRILSPYNGKRISKEVCKGKTLTKELNEKEELVKENIEMKAKIKQLEDSFKKLNSQIKSNTRSISTVNNKITTINSNINTNTGKITKINSGINTIANKIATNTNNIAICNQKIATNNGRITGNSKKINTNTNKITYFNENITTNTANIAQYVGVCSFSSLWDKEGTITYDDWDVSSFSSDGSRINGPTGEYTVKTSGVYSITYSATTQRRLVIRPQLDGSARNRGDYYSDQSTNGVHYYERDMGSRTWIECLKKDQDAFKSHPYGRRGSN